VRLPSIATPRMGRRTTKRLLDEVTWREVQQEPHPKKVTEELDMHIKTFKRVRGAPLPPAAAKTLD
jgi:hypothetical protein